VYGLRSEVELLPWKAYPFCVQLPAREASEKVVMTYQPETPFDNIESAREYVNQLLAATHEAQAEIETELRRATDPELARRHEALQLVKYKLSQLASHISASRRVLNDLTKLRRLLLEARKAR